MHSDCGLGRFRSVGFRLSSHARGKTKPPRSVCSGRNEKRIPRAERREKCVAFRVRSITERVPFGGWGRPTAKPKWTPVEGHLSNAVGVDTPLAVGMHGARGDGVILDPPLHTNTLPVNRGRSHRKTASTDEESSEVLAFDCYYERYTGSGNDPFLALAAWRSPVSGRSVRRGSARRRRYSLGATLGSNRGSLFQVASLSVRRSYHIQIVTSCPSPHLAGTASLSPSCS